jgi:hypothetical protein
MPDQISLFPNYPNPLNPTTTVSFSLPKSTSMKLSIFDITGRTVKTLSDEMMPAGEHQIAFDGTDLPSGIYLASLQAAGKTMTRKIVLLK